MVTADTDGTHRISRPAIDTSPEGLAAPTREAVDEVFAAVRESGAEVLHEARYWPEYHPGYYGVFFRDPDGNNVEAVHHGPPPAEPGS